MKEFFKKKSKENGTDTDFLTLIKVDQIDVKDVSTDVNEDEFKPDYTGRFCIKFGQNKDYVCLVPHQLFRACHCEREREGERERERDEW